ncbi:MAG: Carboxymethylenebutenolidase [Chlamydiae bacterium]|nr:Carboxymethylenebutenolidase [Chlamydiota bacterium]
MKTEAIEYEHAGATLEAFVAYDESKGKRPGILVFHAWGGRDDFAVEKAKWLCSLGYVGCAVDIFGKGVLGESIEENAKLIEPFIKDRRHLRDRIDVALKTVQQLPMVDGENIGGVGFCFGGLCALDLARSGAPVKGVVSLHGKLNAPEDLKNETIQAKVLVLHGHDDPAVPPEMVRALETEMTECNVDWQLHAYGGTMHAFTNPAANNPSKGTLYSKTAERRSLQATENFLHEIFYQA